MNWNGSSLLVLLALLGQGTPAGPAPPKKGEDQAKRTADPSTEKVLLALEEASDASAHQMLGLGEHDAGSRARTHVSLRSICANLPPVEI